jgi:hypothetical protein
MVIMLKVIFCNETALDAAIRIGTAVVGEYMAANKT